MSLILFFILASLTSFSYAEDALDLSDLRLQIRELSEVSAEHSEIIKRQLVDLHYVQNSRGYLEIKSGLSLLNPKDIEDENNDTFSGMDDAEWESFDYANIIDFEIGKSILSKGDLKHEIGIGYQFLRSKELKADFMPNDGGSRIKVSETIVNHTLLARYALLIKVLPEGGFYIGPGMTFGYSPISKFTIELEQGNEGVKVYGENTSFLLEVFGKFKYEFSRYFFLVGSAGYRVQEAENLRLNAAEIASVKTRTDLNTSGGFINLGLGTFF